MAQDPARFLVADCDKGKQVQRNDITQKKGFLNAVSKLGDLGVLNEVGFGKVRNGLSILTQVSNAIRTGQSVVPGRENSDVYNSVFARISRTAIDAVDQGANVVLDATGIGTAAVNAVGAINPGVANQAYGQAKSIFQQVKQGGFNVNQIPGVFQDLQNLEILSRRIFTSDGTQNTNNLIVRCGASPYAVDLIGRAPKMKFLFVLQFIFNSPYSSEFDEYGRGTAFVVKQSTRPSVEFEYDEVNMYNFRTRVPKRTIYQPMTLTFYDDNTNNVTNFYNAYLRAHSPISNIGPTDNGDGSVSSTAAPTLPAQYALDSMNNTLTEISSASLGALANNNVTFIKEVRLFHVYNYGNAMTVYTFYNPKITRLAPDDLTMVESGNGSEMQFEFAYDGLNVIPEYSLAQTNPYDLEQLTGGGIYPIKPEFGTGPSASISASDLELRNLIGNVNVDISNVALPNIED